MGLMIKKAIQVIQSSLPVFLYGEGWSMPSIYDGVYAQGQVGQKQTSWLILAIESRLCRALDASKKVS